MWWQSRTAQGDGEAPGTSEPSGTSEAPASGRPARLPPGLAERVADLAASAPQPSRLGGARLAPPPLSPAPAAAAQPPHRVAPARGPASGAASGAVNGMAGGVAPGHPAAPTARAASAEPDLTGGATPDLYLSHFGLRMRPFSLVPDPGFLFWSQAHTRAYAILEYGVLTRAPITLITGEVGAGKTTLLHQLLRNLGAGLSVGMISNAHGSRGELLRWVLMALNQPVPPGADYVELFATFQRHVIEEYAAGRRVILIFDEAQNLGRETLEELRMFTNINANEDELLQIILVGQPELREIVRRPDMAQFAQRVAASFHLPALEREMVERFIAHRLAVAGAEAMMFDLDAVGLIHAETGGVPRLVNQLCDLALVYAYTRDQKTVGRDTVEAVLNDGVFFGAVRSPLGGAAAIAGGAAVQRAGPDGSASAGTGLTGAPAIGPATGPAAKES